MKLDIIMQGPVWPMTEEIALFYLENPLVNKVIISTWEGEPVISNDRLAVLYNKPLGNPGKNNRNRQTVSTVEGLKLCTAELSLKTRTDQKINSLDKMYNYFIKNNTCEFKFISGDGPSGSIFTVGLYHGFVFHPQDHLFFGFTPDLRSMFYSIPFDNETTPNIADPRQGIDFSRETTRPNTYLAMFYYALFDTQIDHMVKNYKTYIVDNADKIEEARQLNLKYKNKIFKAFPKLDIFWYKHNRDYPYDWGVPYSEYWAEDD